jgi:hypothetical protein
MDIHDYIEQVYKEELEKYEKKQQRKIKNTKRK